MLWHNKQSKNVCIDISSFIAAAFVLIGCTRPVDEKQKTSTVSLSFPPTIQAMNNKFAAFSGTSVLTHVSISVTGPGITTPLLASWERCHDCVNPPLPPSQFEITVPSGESRLFQVITVYENETTRNMTFNYGDAVKTISGDTFTVPVPMGQLNTGTVTKGRVAGRYITENISSLDHGPSGRVNVMYRPAGKPAMIVMRESIVDGWFSFMMLGGLQFEYVVESTGQLLWGQAVDLDSPRINPTVGTNAYNQYRMKLFLPVHNRKNYDGTFEAGDIAQFIWGFYGDTESLLTSKRVCHYDDTPVNTHVYGSTTNLLTAVINNGPSPISASVPTYAQLSNTTSPFDKYTFMGGKTHSGSSCDSLTDSSLFKDMLKVSASNWDGRGNDNVAGFTGIFVRQSGSIASITHSTVKTISGTVLPNMTTKYPKVRAYKRLVVATANGQHIETPDCSRLQEQGFVISGSDSVITGEDYNITTDISAAEGTSGVEVVLCPLRFDGTTYLPSPIGGAYIGKSSLTVAPPSPHSLTLSTQVLGTDASSITNGTCFSLHTELKDSSMNPILNPVAKNVRLTSSISLSYFKVYSTQADCENNNTGSALTGTSYIDFSFPASVATLDLYVRANILASPGNVSFYLNATLPTTDPMTLPGSPPSSAVLFAAPTIVVTTPTPSIIYTSCGQVDLALQDPLHSQSVKLSSVSFSAASSGTTPMSLFNNSSDCASPTTLNEGTVFPTYQSAGTFYFKSAAGTGPGEITFSGSSNFNFSPGLLGMSFY